MKKFLFITILIHVISLQCSERPATAPINITPKKVNSDKGKRFSFSPRSLQRRSTVSSRNIEKRESHEISRSGQNLAEIYGKNSDNLPNALATIDGVMPSTSPDQSLKRNSQQSLSHLSRRLSTSDRPARRTTSGPTPAVSKPQH